MVTEPRRVNVSRRMLRGVAAIVPCEVCGDDLGIHEWVEVITDSDDLDRIVDCDRR